ncbi:MAG: alpha-ketoacid dehydrogenase subunit beta, partial [Gammaproteobacteria bacterium]
MRELTFIEAINEAFHQAMAEDASVLVMGENIRGGMRPETKGLDAAFEPHRVLDMPISEAAFTGFANGAAMAGMRPVVEFQVPSLIYPAFDQIVNQAAKLPLMLGGQVHIPVTFFIMGAGAGGGRAGQHSDNPYPYLVHAGIKTVYPATPQDAKGLLLAAIFEDDPVAYVVHSSLLAARGPVPEAPYRTPLARGLLHR